MPQKKTMLTLALCGIGITLLAKNKNDKKEIVNTKKNENMPTNFYNNTNLSDKQIKFDGIILNPKMATELKRSIGIAVANKVRYKAIASQIGCPWYFVACAHMRESTFNFNKHLHNGEPLANRTRKLVPIGYPKAPPANGKFYTFEESAIDALRLKNFHKWTDWSVGGMLFCLEKFNGNGYLLQNKVNPYLWSGTQYYTSGKFQEVPGTGKGVYKPNVVDAQLGVAVLLKALINL